MAVMAPAAPQTPTSPFPSQNTVQPSSLSRLTLSDKLLLSQAVHHIGTSPPDWGRVSSILLSHPLIKTKSRLEQAAKAGITLGRVFGSRECERAWVALMRQYNLVLQPGERDTSIESEPEAGSPALANRSKEARGLPAKTDRGSQLALAQFLYAERIRELQDSIRAKEAMFKTIVSEIEALNSGSLDDKLLAELERNGQLREEAAAAEADATQNPIKEISIGEMTPTPSQSTPGKSAAVSRAASVSSAPDTSPTKAAAKKESADDVSGSTVKSVEQPSDEAEALDATPPAPELSEPFVETNVDESQGEPAIADPQALSSRQPAETQVTGPTEIEEAAEASLPDAVQVDQGVDEHAAGGDRMGGSGLSAHQGKRKRAKDGVESGAEETEDDVAADAAARKKPKSAEAVPANHLPEQQQPARSTEQQSGQEMVAEELEEDHVVDDDTEEAVGADDAMRNADEKLEEEEAAAAEGGADAETEHAHDDGDMDIDPTEEIEEAGKLELGSSGEAEESADVDEEESKSSKRPEPRRSRRSGKVPTVADDDAPPTPSGSATALASTSAGGAKNNRVEALRSREASGTSVETDEDRSMERDGTADGDLEGDAAHPNLERGSRTSLSPVSARRGRGRPRRSGRGGSTGIGSTVEDTATGSDAERERVAQVAKQRKTEKVLLMLLNEVSNHTHGNLFHAPIKETDAPDYYTLIRHPLDLKTIKSRIKDGRITTATQLRRALMQMFANSLIYNRPGSEIHRMALEMRDAAEEMMDRFEQTQMSANASRR